MATVQAAIADIYVPCGVPEKEDERGWDDYLTPSVRERVLRGEAAEWGDLLPTGASRADDSVLNCRTKELIERIRDEGGFCDAFHPSGGPRPARLLQIRPCDPAGHETAEIAFVGEGHAEVVPLSWLRPLSKAHRESLAQQSVLPETRFWIQRRVLWWRNSEGVRMDEVSWFSVTPEGIARHIALTLPVRCTVVDAFAGAGGNTIQFALAGASVVAVEIDESRLDLARHNARVYGVEDKIEFVCGDFVELARAGRLRGDAVFLAPPWGGPEVTKQEEYDVWRDLNAPLPAKELIHLAREVGPAAALFLPRNVGLPRAALAAAHWDARGDEDIPETAIEWRELVDGDGQFPQVLLERFWWIHDPRKVRVVTAYLGRWAEWASRVDRQFAEWDERGAVKEAEESLVGSEEDQ